MHLTNTNIHHQQVHFTPDNHQHRTIIYTGQVEIKKLGSCLARHTGEEESVTINHLFQKLSIDLMRGNAALFNNRNPIDDSAPDEGLGW